MNRVMRWEPRAEHFTFIKLSVTARGSVRARTHTELSSHNQHRQKLESIKAQ